jgi:hypothetical protein
MMEIPTTYNSICVSGQKGRGNNTQNSYMKTYEFPVVAVASASAQPVGITAPKTVQAIGGYLKVNTAEATGTTKTVSVGVVGAAAQFFATMDVSSTGPVGTPVTGVYDNSAGADFAYILGSADFAELDATMVIWVIGSDE